MDIKVGDNILMKKTNILIFLRNIFTKRKRRRFVGVIRNTFHPLFYQKKRNTYTHRIHTPLVVS